MNILLATGFYSLRFPLVLVALVWSATACAATRCVNSSTALQAALIAAGSNVEADDIRLQAGSYALAGPLYYAPSDSALTAVSGGWNFNCTSKISDPSATVLDGGGTSQILGFNAGAVAGNLTLANLTMENGHASTPGACLYVHTAGSFEVDSSRITNCVNDTTYGGAIFVDLATSVTAVGTTIDHNVARSGPGIVIASAGAITIQSSVISANQVGASGEGGAIGSALMTGGFGGQSPAIEIVDTDITDNVGGALYGGGPSIDIESSYFANNVAIDSTIADECGYLGSGDPNRPPAGMITVNGSVFEGSGNPGSCFHLSASDGNAEGAVGTLLISHSNFSGFAFGAVNTQFSSTATIDHVAFLNNSGYSALESTGPQIRVTHSRFSGNAVQAYPGAFRATHGIGSLTIDNSVFDHNSSVGNGGAIGINLCGGLQCANLATAAITLTSNTFVANTAGQGGGAVWMASVFEGSPAISLWNNLFWQNAASAGQDIYFDDDSDGDFSLTPITLNNNAYDPATGVFIRVYEAPLGSANVAATDPKFVGSASEDYRLSGTSPLIDLGSAGAPSLDTTDAAGLPRIEGSVPDIGAYEYNPDVIFQSGYELP
jgi:hypothetical protein